MAAESTIARSDKSSSSDSSVKETIESILIAFILAFVFRAFVVEAFVIPTGSMAPTLLGAHMRFRCIDCGYRWDVNFSAASSGGRDEENIPAFAETPSGQPIVYNSPGIRCPNCGYRVPLVDALDRDNDANSPPVHYGDRILVLKYAFLLQEPHRWDVVVFKSPHEENPDPTQPSYAQNYIKRLVGKPGERVMILDGDVYIGQAGDALASFKIQRKPRFVQNALWRTVYDNDYIPHLDRAAPPPNVPESEYEPQAPWRQPWQVVGGSGWDLHPGTQEARIFDFSNATGSGELQFDPAQNPKLDPRVHPDVKNLTDWLAYDQLAEQEGSGRSMATVTDLKLVLDYSRLKGEGPLSLKLSKGNDFFTLQLKPGSVELLRSKQENGPTVMRQVANAPELNTSAPVRVELQNIDYEVILSLNGREVFAIPYDPPIDHLLDLHIRDENQPTPLIAISGDHQTCRIQHLALARDVYYISRGKNWASRLPYLASPDKVMDLGPDEYFVLGDNSLISGDARTWDRPHHDEVNLPGENLHSKPGVVPGRFMLGKAFFVYWPAGYRPWTRAPFGIIPNFGEMRFIH